MERLLNLKYNIKSTVVERQAQYLCAVSTIYFHKNRNDNPYKKILEKLKIKYNNQKSLLVKED